METNTQIKIWRYMDLAKFISLLTNEALYFSCPDEFDDPYEGFCPRSYMEAFSKIGQDVYDDFLSTRNQLARMFPSANLNDADNSLRKMITAFREAHKIANRRFGVNCWHMSEYESEAMWRLYSASGQGIAIESTMGRLRESILDKNGLVVDSVRYVDFDKDPIEKGYRNYGLFLKRKSFEHEKEVRATVLLPEEGKGTLVKCKLDVLIGCIHVSPFAKPFFKDVVKNICAGNVCSINKTVIQSSLFDPPDYGIQINPQGI
jgi:hypothetical protein